MKTLILTLLITLSLPVLANSGSPIGLYQVDSSHSKSTLFDDYPGMTGHIDIKKNLGDSKIKIESPDISFESEEFIGNDLKDFVVKGYLTLQGETRLVTLKGQYFGMIKTELNEQKMALRLTSDLFSIRLFATKPAESTALLFKEVQGIIQ